MSDTDTNPLDAAVDLHALDGLTFEGRPIVLDRLGPAHFRSKGFSFMGFLQTVYDHVAQHTSRTPPTEPSAPPATLDAPTAPEVLDVLEKPVAPDADAVPASDEQTPGATTMPQSPTTSGDESAAQLIRLPV